MTIHDLTIEQMREIVEGAPDVAIHYVSKGVKLNLDDLRSIIADHDSREFKVGDLVVLLQFANDFAKEHDALYDLFDFENDLETLAVLSDRKGGEVRSSTQHLRHATLAEFKAGHRIDKQLESDDCTDIRNHLSPSTRVVDL